MWKRIWPSEVPLDPRLDLEGLRLPSSSLEGIRNAALTAAHFAAAEGEHVGPTHLMRAVRREYQKLEREPPLIEGPRAMGVLAETKTPG
jgi:hypothetical protein